MKSLLPATALAAIAAASASPLPGQDVTPAVVVPLLRHSGLCVAGQPCVATAERKARLNAMIAATEQWQPVPPVVRPGATPGAPPSDAIVLFDGRGLDRWVAADGVSPPRWTIAGDVLTVDKTAGNIRTKETFGDYQLHVEWRIPAESIGKGQLRSNSGVLLGSRATNVGFEIQIIDSWNNKTYVNGQAASLYKQYAPLANASRKPGKWQSYDIVWTAPRFRPDGALERPAYVTLFHNGVLVQDHVAARGETDYVRQPVYHAFAKAAIELQAYPGPSAPISFRNIWLRPIAG